MHAYVHAPMATLEELKASQSREAALRAQLEARNMSPKQVIMYWMRELA